MSQAHVGWSDCQWIEYFQCHSYVVIPWERRGDLSQAERTLVAESIREFQQGEGLEGGHFFRVVRQYAQDTGNDDYAEAHRLFMAEEQRHARELARFLQLNGIPLLTRRSWFNRLFCWIGSRGGLEWTLAIIVMVEIVAQAYYRALFHATRSQVLRRICAQILRDEKAHVRFQCEHLARLRHGRRRLALGLTRWMDRVLLLGAGLVCWLGHHDVLRAGGLPWDAYWGHTLHNARRACASVRRTNSYSNRTSTHEFLVRNR